jgi:transglutaminase-like putative cysteine protease
LFEDKAFTYYIFYIIAVLQLYTYRVYLEKQKAWISSQINFNSNILGRWIIISNIIIIILILVSIISPKNFKPITWRWLDEKVQDSFPQLTKWRNMKKASVGYGSVLRFDLSQTQYQDSYKRLGGPVKQEKVLLMKVISKEPVYLRGRVKDFYTGSYWKSTNDSYYHQLINTDINLIDSENIKGETIYQSIQYINLSTSTIFGSYIPKRISYKNNWFYCTDEFELFAGELLLKGDSYKFYSVRKYIDDNLINNSKYRFREEHKKYLQIPNSLPDRVIKLSKDITKDRHSDYDKIYALINYLKSNYKYSLTPKETPHNRDFVDYFLFDEKEGYCTYYASSLAVMARCIGIPSRYVEGFRIPDNKIKGEYYVYSNNAHAWTEVFIEGYGWMTFEPTPGYENLSYTENNDKQKNETLEEYNNTVEDKESSKDQNKKLSKLEMLEEGLVVNRYSSKGKTSEYKYLYKYAIIILAFVFLLIFMRILYSIIKIRILIAQSRDVKNKKAVLNYYIWIMNLLNEINKGKLIHETTIEYSKRIKKEKEFPIEDFNQVTLIFNKAIYSNKNVTSKELDKVKDCFNKCEKLVLNKIGLFKFILLKYITMKFIKHK